MQTYNKQTVCCIKQTKDNIIVKLKCSLTTNKRTPTPAPFPASSPNRPLGHRNWFSTIKSAEAEWLVGWREIKHIASHDTSSRCLVFQRTRERTMAVFTALHTQRVLAPVLSPFECLGGEVVHWKEKWKEKGMVANDRWNMKRTNEGLVNGQ